MIKVRIVEGKKFLWDGRNYESRPEAEAVRQGYDKQGFETLCVEEEGKWFLYTRRLAKEASKEGQGAS